MKIGVVIASKNGFHHLQDCLPTVVAAAKKSTVPVHVTVVDDQSSDDTLKKAPALFPQVTFLGNPQTGACSARNFGVKHTPCDWICFLDNDVFVEEDFFNTVQKYLNAGVFCVACAGYAAYPRQPGAWEQLDGVKLFGWNKGFPRFTRNVYNDSLPDMAEYPSWGVQGAYFFCQRHYFDRLGGFDELLDPYMLEETDLVYRGLKRGWKVVYAPDTKPRHKCGGTINSKKSGKTQFLSKRNRVWFVWKNVHDTPLLWAHWLRFIFSFSPRLWKACLTQYRAFRQAARREKAARQKTDGELLESSDAFEHKTKNHAVLQNVLNTKNQLDYLEKRLFRYGDKYKYAWQIAFHLANACFVSLGFTRTPRVAKTGNEVRFCLVLEGGLGDILLGLNWLCAFYRKFGKNISLCVEIVCENVSLVKAFMPDFVQQVIAKRPPKAKTYDLILACMRCPVVEYANINALPKELVAYLGKLLDFEKENKYFLILSVYKDALTPNILSANPKRWHQADIVDQLNLTEKFLLHIPLKNETETLHKFGLVSKRFITLTREVGYDKVTHSTKLWPVEYYRRLTEKIKKSYPQYQIIEVGCGKGERVGNADKNLTGKTSLEEIKVLLKHALLHIDSEGGLVHLRHALEGGPSCVFFGPTSPDVYGYSENINLCSRACPIHCEFYSRTWQQTCLKQNHACMQALLPQQAFAAIQNARLL